METIRILLSFIVPLVLIFVMIKKKVDTSLALILCAVVSGCVAGLPLSATLSTIKSGFGSIMSLTGLLVLFGVIFSEYLEKSGGIECISKYIAKKTSPQGSIYAIYILGYVISIPVNFTAAAVMMSPMVRDLSKQTKKPVQSYSCAFSVSSFLTNCLVVPTLTPALLAGMAGIEMGPFMVLGIVISLLTSFICALGGALILAKKYGSIEYTGQAPEEMKEDKRAYPPITTVIALILLPILLIIIGCFLPSLLPAESLARDMVSFIGDPSVALLTTIIVEFFLLSKYLGGSISSSLKVYSDALPKAGAFLIVLGAANAFGSVLSAGGIGNTLLELTSGWNINSLLLAFLIVTIIRAGTGVMTVAATATLPLMIPVCAAAGIPITYLVLACCLGCVALIIPTDPAFWIYQDGYKLSVKDTFISVTIPGTAAAVIGIVLLLITNMIFPTLVM